jgi:hypothetical protein
MITPAIARTVRHRAALLVFLAAPVAAQKSPGPNPAFAAGAEAALGKGRFALAESLLYAASERAPHDAGLRAGLGMYLASRGHIKIGTVLLEEARKFGGNAAAIDGHLAQMYPWIGDWTSRAALSRGVLSVPERAQAHWLAAHAPAALGPDSAVISMEPVPPNPNAVPALGQISIVIGHSTILADIVANVDGLVLPPDEKLMREAQLFGKQRIGPELNAAHDSLTVGAVRSMSVGALTLTNVATNFTPGEHAAIGLDVLAPFIPTFDAARRRLTLHRHPVAIRGDTIPFMLDFPGIMLAPRVGQTPMEWDAPASRAALSGLRWTLDLKRGSIITSK